MYKLSKVLLLALTVLALSCAKTGGEPGDNPNAKITLKAQNPGLTLITRTSCSGLTPYWSPSDKIGVCQLSDASNVQFTSDNTAPAPNASFNGPEGQSGQCFAYYPYKAGARSGNNVNLSIAATQYPGASSFDGDSDLLLSTTFTFGNGASLLFNRLTAVAKVILRDKTTGHAITGHEVERLSLCFSGVNVAGDVSLNGENGTLGELGASASGTVEAVHAEGKRYAIDGTSATYFNLYPVNLPADAQIRIEAWAGNLHVCKDTVVPAGGLNLRSGYVSTLLVDIADANVTYEAKAIALNADKVPVALPAATVTVNSLEQFKGLGLTANSSKAGSVVVIKDGTYSNFQAYINAYGTEAKPLVIRAETPGGVTFTGSSYLNVNSAWVRLVGFNFASPTCNSDLGQNYRICLAAGSSHCVVSQCRFDYSGVSTNTNISDNIVDIRIYGARNRVEFCSFLDKKCMGPQIQIQPQDSPTLSEHLCDSVVYCYFTRPTVIMDGSEAANGQESILLGLSRFSQKDEDCYIARNYFYKSDAEHSEVVSIKGCSNIVEENFFKDCWGNLSIRHGKYNTVRRNFLVRSDSSLEKVNGICFQDIGNVIEQNYLYNLPDKIWFAPICALSGRYAPERTETDTEILKSFWQVKNCLIKDNIIRNCNAGITLNAGWSSGWRTLHPINCTFTGNVVYNTAFPIYYYVIDGDEKTTDGHTWTGNMYSVVTTGFHYDVWGQAATKNNINYTFPDSDYEAAMNRISSQAGVRW